MSSLGTRVVRTEDPRLLTTGGSHTDGLRLPELARAVRATVIDTVARLGMRHIDMPATPQRACAGRQPGTELVTEYGGDARFLAGGHSLLPLMKLRLAMPEVLIDLPGR